MQCCRTKISFPVTRLIHDVAPASHFERIQKDTETSFKRFLLAYGMSSVAILYVEIYVLYIEIFMG